MSLSFTRIDVADPERARLLSRVLGALRTPAGEDWLGRICARTNGTWEILLSGPRRPFVAGWETTVVSAERELYRRALAPEHQGVDNVRRTIRALLWDRLTVVLDDVECAASRQLEEAAWDVMTRAGFTAGEVRIARWPSSCGGRRFVATVETHEDLEPRVLWCGVVRTAGDLGRELGLALAPPAATDELMVELVRGNDPRSGSTANLTISLQDLQLIAAGGAS